MAQYCLLRTGEKCFLSLSPSTQYCVSNKGREEQKAQYYAAGGDVSHTGKKGLLRYGVGVTIIDGGRVVCNTANTGRVSKTSLCGRLLIFQRTYLLKWTPFENSSLCQTSYARLTTLRESTTRFQKCHNASSWDISADKRYVTRTKYETFPKTSLHYASKMIPSG